MIKLSGEILSASEWRRYVRGTSFDYALIPVATASRLDWFVNHGDADQGFRVFLGAR